MARVKDRAGQAASLSYYKELKGRVDYDPDSGDMRWTYLPPCSSSRIGGIAGKLNDQGYRSISCTIRGVRKHISAGALAWYISYGEVPGANVRHINGNASDCSIDNLRIESGVYTQYSIRGSREAVARYSAFVSGDPVECIKHGLHSKWRLVEKRCITCRLCQSERGLAYRRRRPLYHLWRQARVNAAKRGLVFDITLEDLKELFLKQEEKCCLSGLPFSEEGDHMVSLDRIDPLKGYEKKNIQLILWMVNRMKSDFKQELFVEICTTISKTAGGC